MKVCLMEVEAKFTVPDRHVYQRLSRCRELAGYVLVPTSTVTVTDTYLDTADHRLLEGGYACRLRNEGDQVIATLKGLGGANGAIHSRDEQEAVLPVWTPRAADWPKSSARSLALRLSGGAELEPLFELTQRRARAKVLRGDHMIAEWSLDAVRLAAGAMPVRYYELEIELKGRGKTDDLTPLVEELTREWRLAPEPRSKFQRALETFRRVSAGNDLSDEERALLAEYAARAGQSVARRAAVVLGWAAGLPTREIAVQAGLSVGRARYWLRAFRIRRLGIFVVTARRQAADRAADSPPLPDRPLTAPDAPAQADPPAEYEPSGDVPLEQAQPQAAGAPEPPTTVEQPAPRKTPSQKTPSRKTPSRKADKRQVWVVEATAAPPEPPTPPVLSPDEPMAEVGRKLLYFHFQRMLYNEPGTREGEDAEALHDMRVATRRMRAAVQLIQPYFDPAALKPFNKELRRVARALGAVRDLDVLIGKARDFEARTLDATGEDQGVARTSGPLAPLLAAWDAQREDARRDLVDCLDSDKYRKFKPRFEAFLTTAGAGALTQAAADATAPAAYQARHVVAGVLFGRFERVRAFEPLLPAAPLPTYHALRIECKRLRYAMEFFRDMLGPQAQRLIKLVTAMQDVLGDLHDSVVTEEMVTSFLHQEAANHVAGPARSEPAALQQGALPARGAPLEGVAGYLVAQWAIQRDLLARFPAAWADLIGPDFRRDLSLAVAVL
jgi:CHAD domain-containing protein